MSDPMLAYERGDDAPAIHWQVMEGMGSLLYRSVGQFTDEQDAVEYASVEFDRSGRSVPFIVYRITREVVKRFVP